MTEKERMLAGRLYKVDSELEKAHIIPKRLIKRFNSEDNEKIRAEILSELFSEIGKGCHIEPPFRCEYGKNIYIGNNFYANFECLFLDVNKIEIGSNVLLGPRVSIYTAGHPIDVDVRNELLEYGKPVKIEDNVWIGGSTVINPGVTIGRNSVIGSGSVVTKNVPPNTVAAGNPCRVIREIGEKDREYWKEKSREYYNSL